MLATSRGIRDATRSPPRNLYLSLSTAQGRAQTERSAQGQDARHGPAQHKGHDERDHGDPERDQIDRVQHRELHGEGAGLSAETVLNSVCSAK
ncbi:hypothetical protein GCM10018965_058680 [Nonomuraea roseola]